MYSFILAPFVSTRKRTACRATYCVSDYGSSDSHGGLELNSKQICLPRRHVLGLVIGAWLAASARDSSAEELASKEVLELEKFRDPDGAFAILRPSAWAQDKIVGTHSFARSSGIGRGPGVAFLYLLDPSENMSVLGRSCAGGCVSLRELGTAGAFGRHLVRSVTSSTTPSLRVAYLVSAHERVKRGRGSDMVYYVIEYEVHSPAWTRRNICVAAMQDGMLYTLNMQAPAIRWAELSGTFHTIAESFELL